MRIVRIHLDIDLYDQTGVARYKHHHHIIEIEMINKMCELFKKKDGLYVFSCSIKMYDCMAVKKLTDDMVIL